VPPHHHILGGTPFLSAQEFTMIIYLPGRDSALNLRYVQDIDWIRDGHKSFVCWVLLSTGEERFYRGQDAELLRKVVRGLNWQTE
jgi:hypothetical protein